MRITVNLDDDVLLAVQERSRREKRTAGQVLSDRARESLTRQRLAAGGVMEHHGSAAATAGPCRL